MGKALAPVTDLVGLTDTRSARNDARAAQAWMERGVQAMQNIELPDVEKMKLLLEEPQLVQQLVAETVDRSTIEDIKVDPRLQASQMQALEMLKQRGDQGLTEEDRIAFRQFSDQTAQDEQARQASILANMEQRGMSDSGTSLAAQLSSNQAAAQRQQQQGAQMAQAALQAKRDALAQSGNIAGQMGAQQFEQGAKKASAKDAINQFNTLNRQNIATQNITNKQRIADNTTNLRNEQQMFNKQLAQQDFENKYRKAGGTANAYNNASSFMTAKAQTQAQADQATFKEMSNLLDGTKFSENVGNASKGIGAMFGSDEEIKTNIKEVSDKKIESKLSELLNKITPYSFDYKDSNEGKGNRIGVMAQDLEKSDLGKDMVKEDNDGIKRVDVGELLGTNIAATKVISDKLNKLEKLLKQNKKK
jgi:hypothetical protein